MQRLAGNPRYPLNAGFAFFFSVRSSAILSISAVVAPLADPLAKLQENFSDDLARPLHGFDFFDALHMNHH
jgi:hypothetical protein